MRTERALGHQFHGSSELVRELLLQLKPPESEGRSILGGTERHEDVDVTARSGVPPGLRTEKFDA